MNTLSPLPTLQDVPAGTDVRSLRGWFNSLLAAVRANSIAIRALSASLPPRRSAPPHEGRARFVGIIYQASRRYDIGLPSATNRTLIYEPGAATQWYYSDTPAQTNYPPTRMEFDLVEIAGWWPIPEWRVGG